MSSVAVIEDSRRKLWKAVGPAHNAFHCQQGPSVIFIQWFYLCGGHQLEKLPITWLSHNPGCTDLLHILEVIFSNEGFLFVCLSFAFFGLFVCFICLFAVQKKSVLYCDDLVRSEPELKLIRNRNRPILIHNQNSDPFFWRVLVSQIRETMLERWCVMTNNYYCFMKIWALRLWTQSSLVKTGLSMASFALLYFSS